MGLKTLNDAISKLEELMAIQSTNGVWNYNSYNLGVANGVRVALGILEGKEPNTLAPPDAWLEDSESHQAFLKVTFPVGWEAGWFGRSEN